MDRLGAMQLFVRVVDSGSFSAAGRMAGMGQPAVSKLIAQLEERLGTPLLTRTTRRLALTDAGRVFYSHAIGALEAADEAEMAVQEAASGLVGPLKICMPVSFARLNIVPRLGPFLAANPGIALDLILDDRHIDLIGEAIDLAVRVGPLQDSSLVATRLAEAERLVVATPQWVASAKPIETPRDFAAASPVIYAAARNWIFARDGETELVALTHGLRVSAAEGQRAAVLAHLGPTIASRWLFGDALADGRVVQLLAGWQLPMAELWMVSPAGRHVNARTRAFMDFLKGLMAGGDA